MPEHIPSLDLPLRPAQVREQLLGDGASALNDAEARIEECEAEIEELQHEVRMLGSRLATSEMDANKAREQANAAQLSVDELASLKERAAEQCTQLSVDLEASQIELAEMTRRAEAHAAKLVELEGLLAEQQAGGAAQRDAALSEVERLRAERDDALSQASAAESELAAVLRRASEAEQGRDAAQLECESLRRERSGVNATAEVNEEITATRMRELETQLAEGISLLAEAKTALARETAAVGTTKNELQIAEQRLTALEKVLDVCKAEAEAAKAVNQHAAREEVARAQAEAREARDEVARAHAEAKEAQERADELARGTGEMRVALGEAQTLAQERGREAARLRKLLKDLQGEDAADGSDGSAARLKAAIAQLEVADFEIARLQDLLRQVTAASRVERERLIACTLASLSSLRSHLTLTFTGGAKSGMLVNGRDPVPDMRREAAAACSRTALHRQAAAQGLMISSTSLPALPRGRCHHTVRVRAPAEDAERARQLQAIVSHAAIETTGPHASPAADAAQADSHHRLGKVDDSAASQQHQQRSSQELKPTAKHQPKGTQVGLGASLAPRALDGVEVDAFGGKQAKTSSMFSLPALNPAAQQANNAQIFTKAGADADPLYAVFYGRMPMRCEAKEK